MSRLTISAGICMYEVTIQMTTILQVPYTFPWLLVVACSTDEAGIPFF